MNTGWQCDFTYCPLRGNVEVMSACHLRKESSEAKVHEAHAHSAHHSRRGVSSRVLFMAVANKIIHGGLQTEWRHVRSESLYKSHGTATQ